MQRVRGGKSLPWCPFAWATAGGRRSEVASATLENLQRVDANSYLYTLAHSKTNQAGAQRPDDVKPVVGSAAQAMQAWLAASGIQEGALFRRIRKGGHLGEPLAPAAVRDILKERCAIAGVEGRQSVPRDAQPQQHHHRSPKHHGRALPEAHRIALDQG